MNEDQKQIFVNKERDIKIDVNWEMRIFKTLIPNTLGLNSKYKLSDKKVQNSVKNRFETIEGASFQQATVGFFPLFQIYFHFRQAFDTQEWKT